MHIRAEILNICIHIHTYIHTYMYTCTPAHTHTHTHTHAHHLFLPLEKFLRVSQLRGPCVCMYVCMYVFMCQVESGVRVTQSGLRERKAKARMEVTRCPDNIHTQPMLII